jgi:hypothetical protein
MTERKHVGDAGPDAYVAPIVVRGDSVAPGYVDEALGVSLVRRASEPTAVGHGSTGGFLLFVRAPGESTSTGAVDRSRCENLIRSRLPASAVGSWANMDPVGLIADDAHIDDVRLSRNLILRLRYKAGRKILPGIPDLDLVSPGEVSAGLVVDTDDGTVIEDIDDARPISSEQQELISILLDKLSPDMLASALKAGKTLEQVAERMVSSFPETNELDASVGPFYDTPRLRKWLGLTKQGIAHRMKTGAILGVKSSDGFWMYPAFQFTSKGEPLPRLKEVLDAIDPGGGDFWQSAIWLNHAMEKFDGMTPAEALRTDRADAVVATAARIRSALAR